MAENQVTETDLVHRRAAKDMLQTWNGLVGSVEDGEGFLMTDRTGD